MPKLSCVAPSKPAFVYKHKQTHKHTHTHAKNRRRNVMFMQLSPHQQRNAALQHRTKLGCSKLGDLAPSFSGDAVKLMEIHTQTTKKNVGDQVEITNPLTTGTGHNSTMEMGDCDCFELRAILTGMYLSSCIVDMSLSVCDIISLWFLGKRNNPIGLYFLSMAYRCECGGFFVQQARQTLTSQLRRWQTFLPKFSINNYTTSSVQR